MKNLIIIPARLESTRLPNKPLADINGEPMIAHVYKRAKEANIAKVIVAAGNVEIKEVIENIGGEAILTNPDHASGSDRIYEALNMYDKESKFDIIVNLQGDLPNIHKDALSKIISLLESNDADISTLGVKISSEEQFLNTNIVKKSSLILNIFCYFNFVFKICLTYVFYSIVIIIRYRVWIKNFCYLSSMQ